MTSRSVGAVILAAGGSRRNVASSKRACYAAKWWQRDGRTVDVRLYGLLREDYEVLTAGRAETQFA